MILRDAGDTKCHGESVSHEIKGVSNDENLLHNRFNYSAFIHRRCFARSKYELPGDAANRQKRRKLS